MKLFVTGDVHIGLKFANYPEISDQLIQSRFDCLEKCVAQAEKEACDYFVITGDLFDNINRIPQKQVKAVVDILSGFSGLVLVLPGNHDYYTGEEKVWKDFREALGSGGSIVLFTEMKPYSFGSAEEKITFYPAFCQSKHSSRNHLEWIRNTGMDGAGYHVGVAHGTLEGVSPDMKNEYFLMTEKELNSFPVDAWLIGHTHIPYPREAAGNQAVSGYKIFNPGTPEQTDLGNNTAGFCFLLTLEKEAGKTRVTADSYQSGGIRYYDLPLAVGTEGLRTAVEEAVKELPEKSVVRLKLSGAVPEQEYGGRQRIYDDALGRFLTYEIEDGALCETITTERIRREFAEIGFAAELLESLNDKERQMAYELIKRHQKQEGRK